MATPGRPLEAIPILKYFAYHHLPEELWRISQPFNDLAHKLSSELDSSAELSAGLRKLLEAKDCMVRAAMTSYGAGLSEKGYAGHGFTEDDE